MLKFIILYQFLRQSKGAFIAKQNKKLTALCNSFINFESKCKYNLSMARAGPGIPQNFPVDVSICLLNFD